MLHGVSSAVAAEGCFAAAKEYLRCVNRALPLRTTPVSRFSIPDRWKTRIRRVCIKGHRFFSSGEKMPRRVIYTDKLMRPIAHFSHASRVANIVHVGASAGVFPDLRLAGDVPGRVDMEAQTRRMFANLRTTLQLLGAETCDVVRLKAYVADTRDIAKYLDVFAEEFRDMRPAHSVIGSWSFPLPQAAVEIDTVAIVDGKPLLVPDVGLCVFTGSQAGGIVVGDQHYSTALPIEADGSVSLGDTGVQIAVALRNLSTMLNSGGFTAGDICSLHVTILDIRDYSLVEREFSNFFGDHFPTWTVVGAPLEVPQLRIAIESIAIKGGGRPISSSLSPLRSGGPAPGMLAGELLFLSGQGAPPAEDVTAEEQANAAWRRLQSLIESAGFGHDTMLRTNNVLTDWRDFQGFNAGYGPNIAEPYVPRATVLGHLTDVRAKVQIEGIAHRQGGDAQIIQVAPVMKR